MAFVVKDRVKETSTTTGTGTLTLAGAVSGFRSFADIGNANTTAYVILEGSESTPTAWEVGVGTYTASGTTLSRDTVLRTSAGDTTKITLASGTHTVFCGLSAEIAVTTLGTSEITGPLCLGDYLRLGGDVYDPTDATTYIKQNGGGFQFINRNTVGNIPLQVKGMASQSGNLTNWYDSTNNILASISASGTLGITPAANTGVLASTGYSLTGSDATSMVNLAGTWNTTGTPTLILATVTNTASNAASLFLDFQASGVSKMSIDISGRLGTNFKLFQPDTSTWGVSSNSLGWVSKCVLKNNGFQAHSTAYYSWASLSDANGLIDTFLYRDGAAGTVAQRNGANAQTLRVYGTYTDASNYERAAIKTTAGSKVELAAETAGTGGDNLDVVLTPAGTGVVKFGSYTALGAEALAGYITIKDAAGNTRKLAVIA